MVDRDTIQRRLRSFPESLDLSNAESTRLSVKLTAAWSFVLWKTLGQQFPSLVTMRAPLREEISVLTKKCITLSLGSTNLFDGYLTVV